MTVSVVILTRDEAMHIERAIRSVQSFATEVLVVDSGSTDGTVELAQNAGARVLHNPRTNHATQTNWAIPRVADDAEWIMRLDADEIVQPDLTREIRHKLPGIGAETDGILVSRRMSFMAIADARGGQAGMKRWLKDRVYARLPGGSRAFAYFLYRYVVRLGFLDGVEGTAFHVLQGLWYRYLVDMKLRETRAYIVRTGCHPSEAVRDVLGIDLGGRTLAADGA